MVVLLLITGWFLRQPFHWALLFVLGVADLVAISELIHFVNSTNRQMSYFIHAVKNDDTSLRFPERTGNSIIDELHVRLNELNELLQKTKVKSRIKEQYFSEILENIATGVMVVDEKGFVTDVNAAVLDLLGVNHLSHLSQLERIDKEFKSAIDNIEAFQKQVVNLRKRNETLQLIVRCSVIDLKHENIRLITLQDIRGELERKEIDSWVKLIRVLNHEIMNSLTPVTSIAQVLEGIWKERVKKEEAISADKDVESTIDGLAVIGERGESLIRFVKSYRALTKAPEPKLTAIDSYDFLDRLRILVSPLKDGFGGQIIVDTPADNFTFFADEQMIVQVVINLVKNAVEALQEIVDPKVRITIEQNASNIFLNVEDNGMGIPPEIMDEIFIPFFTTKENGSGIGLSLSRHILRLHSGTLKVNSVQGEKTQFTLVLPKR